MLVVELPLAAGVGALLTHVRLLPALLEAVVVDHSVLLAAVVL